MEKRRFRWDQWCQLCFWAAFVIYAFFVIGMMFLGGRGHRDPGESLWEYIRFSVNPIPFKTIGNYIYLLRHHAINRALVIRNICGNLALFFPMGIFLPTLFMKMRKLWRTALSVFGIVLGAECLQILLRRGIFDIDDLILNLTGAVAGYFCWKLFFKIYCKMRVSYGIL